jgi:hypothetical protein
MQKPQHQLDSSNRADRNGDLRLIEHDLHYCLKQRISRQDSEPLTNGG